MAGYDTAGEIQNVYEAAHSEFGADPNFWLRYLQSPAADGIGSDPVTECEACWASGTTHVGVIHEPTQSDLASNSVSLGQSTAQAFASAVYNNLYLQVGPLQLPTNGQLYCWLGQEATTSLTNGYWNGWAETIDAYVFANTGTAPMYPCLYCDPPVTEPNCSIIDNPDNIACFAVWSSEPEPCKASIASPPGWDADSCASVPTKLWQYAEQMACGLSANVDLDEGAPGFNNADYCFYLAADP
jgi:hypothetical protein